MRHLSELIQSVRLCSGTRTETFKPVKKDDPPFKTAGRRTLYFSGSMTLRDAEWPAADKVVSLQLGTHFASVGMSHRKVMYFEGRCGGEVRLEMDVFASLGAYDSIIVNLDVRLYEGTSDSSTDLDGRGNFTVVIPATQGDNIRSLSATVWNTEENEYDDQGFFMVKLANHP
ncbi:MAG: hypothetical protein JNL67_02165 [Planctomycetaceae bacterium]|nr:hypothetical protein [Planctomycetaceae bacterium]